MTSAAASNPVRIEGRLTEPLGRGLWLVKWALIIPHLLVLSLLWVAVGVVSVAAFFAILFTGRYPRPLFDFTVAVLRWSWRVAFYGYSALGTDRYPPFSLEERPEYPATLYIDYPARLSRGLVLVKWLLGLPQLIIIGFFLGGGYLVSRGDHWAYSAGGLISILVLVAGVIVLFTGRYPRPLFDLILGLDRWVVRVVAYVALLTDEYPPFRLDQGGSETRREQGSSETADAMPTDQWPRLEKTAPVEPPPAGPPPANASRWSAGRITAVIVGSLVVLCGLAPAAGGGALVVASSVMRAENGMVTSPTEQFATGSSAILFGPADLGWLHSGRGDGVGWLGEIQVNAQSVSSDVPLFVGIAPESDVTRYLSEVRTATVTDISLFPFTAGYGQQAGSKVATPPAGQSFWVASSSGVGPQTLTWDSTPGRWMLVVMNADGSAGVKADLSVGAELPFVVALGWILLSAGLLLVVIGATVIIVGVAGSTGRGSAPQLPGPPTARPLVRS